ncbi:MAG: formylmethanofuran dehydrogenase subunit [Archaeoglobi archaeon]|nr:formylmethanofuran dehydrogenase subunit A [Candidatus Mnemosynella bozhongmuii]MDK2781245.1 formylmethanofuran dehydrogenase subunit [Archaeoglobi archaeon]
MRIHIKNGIVFDPLNNVHGEVMDIFIEDGKIVEECKAEKTIDASGKLVFPGGIDIHSHITGPKVTAGRILRPEDHRRCVERRKNGLHSGTGFTIPSTRVTGYRYARMGYTTVVEAAMPPLEAKHTHEEITSTPIIDIAPLTLFGNNWNVMEFAREKDYESLSKFISWMLRTTKGFGVKLVNPGGVENWGWGKDVDSIHSKVLNFDVTPAEIIRALAISNDLLRLPHSIHIHFNNLGHPGNYETTLESMKLVEDLKGERQSMHATHLQFHAYGGDSWKNMRSESEKIADYINRHEHITADMGQVILGDTTTMTSDGPMEFSLHRLSGRKWSNHDVELETGAGIIPVFYSSRNAVNSIQWAIGLELGLLIEDPWKIFVSTDHPNGGSFLFYPHIISWLMSRKRREKTLSRVHSAVNSRAILGSVDRERDFSEICIMTRSGPAKALGLHKYGKGHLGTGADADVAIYDIDPREVDPSEEYNRVLKAFKQTFCTIKGGEIVSQNGEIVSQPEGRTIWCNAEIEEDEKIRRRIEKKFYLNYTVSMSNYPVFDEYVPNPMEIKIEVK